MTTTPTPPVTDSAGLPLLKWVGGKTRLLPHITPLYQNESKIVEPFFGGGAVGFHLAAQHPNVQVVANDKTTPLMEIYEAVREDVETFIINVDQYAEPYLALPTKGERRAFYYDLRDKYLTGEVDGPVPLFFMLRCAFSGLYRTSKKYPGRFHTPHGFGGERPGFYFPHRLRAAAELMQSWTLLSSDFEQTLNYVDSDTFVFLDPPYRQSYTKYTPDGFNDDDQVRVVEYFHAAHKAGARVVYTNRSIGDTFYDEHFEGFTQVRIPIRYQVNNGPNVNRPETNEVLIHN